MRTPFLCLAAALFSAAGLTPSAFAQDTLAQESSRRQAILARLPADAAKRVFGLATSPAPGPARPIGDYTKGCVAGAVAAACRRPELAGHAAVTQSRLGSPGPDRVSARLAQKLPGEAGWPGLLVGDIGAAARRTDADRPRLAPDRARCRHLADADARSPADARPSGTDLGNRCCRGGRDGYRSAVWTPRHRRLLEAFAREPVVERIFVNPAIKRALCREAGADRAWMAKIRPWWGHNYHFHVRLSCPSGEPNATSKRRRRRATAAARNSIGGSHHDTKNLTPRAPSIGPLLSEMPPACAALARGP